MKKIRVRDTAEDGLDITGDIGEVVTALMTLAERFYQKGWTNLKIEHHQHAYDYGELILTGEREETDNEFKSRIKNLEIVEKNKEAAKEKRKKQYERLKQEFEK